MLDTKISRRSFVAISAATTAAMAGCSGGGVNWRQGANWGQLDSILSDAVSRKDVPFAVAMLANSKGTIWQGSAGDATPTRKAGLDTAFRIFSMTKGIGTLAAMMLVERNKISLDTTVGSVLPELGKIQVFDSMGPNGPVYRQPKRPVTLRHLLTHTSGLAYNVWDSKQNDWESGTKAPGTVSGLRAGLVHPLMFDPGDAWTYGVGIDWAGFMVEAIDGRRIDQFVQQEILSPLRMTSTVFEPDSIRDRLPVTKVRGADGSFGEFDLAPPSKPEVYGMGQALYSTAPDYIRFLRMILNNGELDGQRLVSAATVAQMKANQIGAMSVPVMKTVIPFIGADVDFFPGTRKTHTFGFLRNEVDIPGMRSAGSLSWAGVLNTHYWIDPKRDVTAVLMTQSLPFVEPRFMDVYSKFEKAVYQGLS